MSDKRGQDNRPHLFGDDEPKQEFERRDEENDHEHLSQLDADVERQERCE